ncbi:hypothetical protein N7467_012028 [Penicillium canescens]|nr:hypothetical protein N7467_012028 [Penicillium canescens]
MRMMNEILHAATFLTENLHGTDTQELLYYHRRELQLAFDSLKKLLGTPASRQIQPSPPSNDGGTHSHQTTTVHHQDRPLVRNVLSSVPPPLQQPEPCSSARSEVSSEASFIQAQERCVEAIHPLDHPQKLPDEISGFMKKLKSESKAIRHFLDRNAENAIAKDENWTGDDFFMIDIELSERRVTRYQKFRGWLARYLYAERYLTWAEKTYSQPRKTFLILNQKDLDNRGKGRIKEYLIVIKRNDSKNHRAIKYGVKYHSFEEVYGNQGVCAILSQVFTTFRDIPYLHFRSLAEELRKSPEWSSLAEEKADWLSKCLSIYRDERVEYERKHGRKHFITTEDLPKQGQRKRVRASLPTVTAEASATANVITNASSNNAPTNQLAHENLNPFQSLDGEPVARLKDTVPLEDFDNLQDFDSTQDFDPFQDFNLPQDYDPFQDFNLPQDYDPFQDFNIR